MHMAGISVKKSDIQPLIDAGAALHWLHPRTKRPIGDDWSKKPVWTLDELTASHRPGNNVGLRLGEPSKVCDEYLHVLDIDIRTPEAAAEAHAWLDEHLPTWRTFPRVRSGSGGESRHIYLTSSHAFRSRKVAHSAEKYVDAQGKRHWRWEIELFGTGKQVAIPPSIHPDTGNPYVWEQPFDFESLELVGVTAASVEPKVVQAWAPSLDSEADQTEKEVLGLDTAAAQVILNDLPYDAWGEDRDGWLTVGMALHHEFSGAPAGFHLWDAWSKPSKKYNAEDQRRVWKSFVDKPNSVRMATLVKAANHERLMREFEDVFDEPAAADDDDLGLGDLLGQDDDDLGLGDLMALAPSPESAPWSPPDGADWLQKLDLNEDGGIRPHLHNMTLIIRNDPRTSGVCRLNQLTAEVVQKAVPRRKPGKSPKGIKQLTGPIWRIEDPVNGDLWIDSHDHAVRDVIEAPKRQGGYGLKVSDRDLRGAIDIVAWEMGFHPIRDYLGALVWDGVPRLDTLFIRHLGAEDNAYSRNIARLVLTGAVTRAYEPGHKFDFVAILEGVQGKRKSTFIEVLSRGWFTELEGDFHDRKRLVENMQGAWICELPELQGLNRADVRVVKAFVSAKTDKVRLAYAKRAQEFKRQCIFIGSTNEDEYLKDDTGGRRFWPVACTVDTIDTDALAGEMDQVWAEAVAAYRDMRAAKPRGQLPLYLTDEAAKIEAERIQESRRVESVEDTFQGQIEAWLESPPVDASGFDEVDEDGQVIEAPRREFVCTLEIWVDCLGFDRKSCQQPQAQMIGRVMRKIQGWAGPVRQYTEKWGRQRGFFRLKR